MKRCRYSNQRRLRYANEFDEYGIDMSLFWFPSVGVDNDCVKREGQNISGFLSQ